MDQSGERVLRAKYLDWCSAQLAERFLDLSPETIYELARGERADVAEATDPGEPGDPGDPGQPGEPAGGEPPGREPGEAQTEPFLEAGPSGVTLPRPTDQTYRVLVQRVTESLLVRTPLPSFEQWSMAYEEAPERFEAELLGFWRDVVAEDAGAEDAGGEGGASGGPGGP